jgi:hypothetical protein
MSKFSKLTTALKNSANVFFNMMREVDPELSTKYKQDLSFLRPSENQAIIHERIMTKYKNLGTQKQHLNNLGVIIRDYLAPQPDDGQPKRGKKPKSTPIDPGDGNVYIKEAIAMLKAINDKKIEDDDLGIKGDLKNFLGFDQIVKRMREFEALVKEDPTNRKNAMCLLVIQLNVYQPPLRRTIPTMKIIKNKEENNGVENFLYIKSNTEMWYIVNDDKVKAKKTDEFLKELPLFPNACRAVEQSLQLFPRDVLITQFLNGKQATQVVYDNYLKYIFRDLDGWKFTQNNFRNSYITNFLAGNPSVKKVNEVARLMRTSPQQMRETYNFRQKTGNQKPITPLWDEKKGDPKKDEKIEEIEKPKSLDKQEILKMLEKKIKNGFNVKEWGAKYRPKPKNKARKDKFNEKYYEENKKEFLRKKIIKNLNSGNTVKPTNKSVETYNLKYDASTKKWF